MASGMLPGIELSTWMRQIEMIKNSGMTPVQVIVF
jgi:hypothetical protein